MVWGPCSGSLLLFLPHLPHSCSLLLSLSPSNKTFKKPKQKHEKCQINNPNFLLKNLEKEEPIKPKQGDKVNNKDKSRNQRNCKQENNREYQVNKELVNGK